MQNLSLSTNNSLLMLLIAGCYNIPRPRYNFFFKINIVTLIVNKLLAGSSLNWFDPVTCERMLARQPDHDTESPSTSIISCHKSTRNTHSWKIDQDQICGCAVISYLKD